MTTAKRGVVGGADPTGEESSRDLELVHAFDGTMPTGVSVSHSGRVFACFGDGGDRPPARVVEIRDGAEVPYPDETWNAAGSRAGGPGDEDVFGSVQSVVVDPADRLWVLDTGSPASAPTRVGPKLVGIDLTTDQVVQSIGLPTEVAPDTRCLADVRFDLGRGEAGAAFITDSSDSGDNGIVVVDLATGEAWRRLDRHPSTTAEPPSACRPEVEGRELLRRRPGADPQPLTTGVDGVAITADGRRLWYCPLVSRRWYSVSADALFDRSVSEDEVADTVVDEGDKGTAAGGLESDDAGRVYLAAVEHEAVLRRLPDGAVEPFLHDPRLLWPQALSVAPDPQGEGGHLYVLAGQLHRHPDHQEGEDLREKPYLLFRTPVDGGPVRLRPAASP